MNKEQLIEKLKEIRRNQINSEGGDIESDHSKADDSLLAFIGDPDVTELFNVIEKWYA